MFGHDPDIFTWRSITESIRHISIIFIAAFVITIVVKDYSVMTLIEKAMNPEGLAGIFCAVMVWSIPVYLICMIIDTIDSVRIVGNLGFIADFFARLFYDITYIFMFTMSTWIVYIIVFLILAAFCAFGIIFLL